MNAQGAAQILYKVFRNPLVHTAGVQIRRNKTVKIATAIKSESGMTSLESASSPLRPLLVANRQKTVLWLDTLVLGNSPHG
jgi:hypothetical protein